MDLHVFVSEHSSKINGYEFVCPNDGVIKSGQEDFIITVNGWSDSSIDVFKIGSSDMFLECAHTLTPPEQQLLGATGGVFVDKNKDFVPLICGGETVGVNLVVERQACLLLSADQDSFLFGSQLNVPRVGAASLVIDNGDTLWVTGGYNEHSGYLGSTELVQMRELTNKSSEHYVLKNVHGIGLPKAKTGVGLKYHCLAQVSKIVALITGGQKDENSLEFMTQSIDVRTMIWRDQANLDKPRYNHVCGTLTTTKSGRKIVIVAGGHTSLFVMTDTVETLLVNEDNESFASKWEYGPNLPMPVSKASSATSSTQQDLFLIGGNVDNDNSQASKVIFKLQCSTSMDCQWTKLKHELTKPSANGLALVLPSNPMVDIKESPDFCVKGEDLKSCCV